MLGLIHIHSKPFQINSGATVLRSAEGGILWSAEQHDLAGEHRPAAGHLSGPQRHRPCGRGPC